MAERPGMVALATLAIVGSYLTVRSGRSAELDRQAAKALAYPLGHRFDKAVSAYTDLGSVYGMAGLAGVLAAAGHRRAAAEVLVGGSTAWVVAQAAKPLIGRERPYLADGADRLVAVPAGSSWPSGHVAVATAMGACLTPHLDGGGRRAVRAAVAGVAASRCYVGVHHLTDVIAGWGLGAPVGAGVRRLWPRGKGGKGLAHLQGE